MQAEEDEEGGSSKEADDDDDKGGLVAALRKVCSLAPAMTRLTLWIAEHLRPRARSGPQNLYIQAPS